MKQISLLFAAVVWVCAASLNCVAGGWPGDPKINLPIGTGQLEKSHPFVAPDGKGGSFIAWQDARNNGALDIYAQRIDINGNPRWTANGAVMCNANDAQLQPTIIQDTSGGAYIIWLDARNANGGNDTDIYATCIDSLGKTKTGWPNTLGAQGLAVCRDSQMQRNFTAISDNHGGVYIAWEDSRLCFKYDTTIKATEISFFPPKFRYDTSSMCNPAAQASPATTPRVYLQHLIQSGRTWQQDGIGTVDSVHKYSQTNPRLVADSNGGVFVIWTEKHGGSDYIFFNEFNTNGSWRFDSTGQAVCIFPSVKNNLAVASDRTGGFYVGWEDSRNASSTGWDIFAQHIGSDGSVLWGNRETGQIICDAGQDQVSTSITSDSNGNAYFVWQDSRNFNVPPNFFANDLYGQHVNAPDGSPRWAANGIALVSVAHNQINQLLHADGANGFYLAWMDYRADNSTSDIYSQRFNENGKAGWAMNNYTGVPVSDAANMQDQPAMCISGGGVILVWHDDRTTNDQGGDVYAQKVYPEGNLPVEIISFTATPTKNENVVNVAWTTATEINTLGFEVMRQRDAGAYETIAGFASLPALVAQGVAGSGATYAVEDDAASGTRCAYKLVAVDNDGSRREFGPAIVQLATPAILALEQNYPNPFSGFSVVGFSLPHSGDVAVHLTDMLGRNISTSVMPMQSAGWHSWEIDGTTMRPGAYFLRIESAGMSVHQLVTVTK